MTNCVACTSATVCTSCSSGFYLNYLGSGCVSSCNSDEIGLGIQCVKCTSKITNCVSCT